MGNSQSAPGQAEHCKFTKVQFKYLLAIIQDSHSVMQFYASSSLLPRIPVKFAEYRNYNSYTEEYFNSVRNIENPKVGVIDPFMKNYYDIYAYIKGFSTLYESLKDDVARKDELGRAFNITYGVMKLLIEELLDNCTVQ